MTRTRSETYVPIIGVRTQERDGVTYVTYPTKTFSGSRSMTDVSTTDFARKRDRGLIVNSPCTSSKDSITCGGGYYYGRLKTSPYTEFESVGAGSLTYWRLRLNEVPSRASAKPAAFNSPVVDSNAALINALNKVDSSTYAFGEDVAEVRETIKFLMHPFQSLCKLGLKFRESFFKKASKHSRLTNAQKVELLTSTYLEYRFAVTPLVKSIADLVWYLNSGVSISPPKRRTAHSVFQAEEFGKDQVTYDAIQTFSRERKENVTLHAYILYEVNNPCVGIKSDLGFRLKDIPETLWAVCPYSFMVDRLVNFSDYFRAITNLLDPNVVILTSGYSTTRKVQVKHKYLMQESPAYDFIIAGDELVYDSYVYERVPYVITTTSVKPVVDNRLVSDVTSIMDLAALTLQRFVF